MERIHVGSASIVFSDRWTPSERVLYIHRANLDCEEMVRTIRIEP